MLFEDLKENKTVRDAFREKRFEELRNNYDFMLETIKLDPWLLHYASKKYLKNNKDIALAAVKKPG